MAWRGFDFISDLGGTRRKGRRLKCPQNRDSPRVRCPGLVRRTPAPRRATPNHRTIHSAGLSLIAAAAHADINGFNSLSGWTYNTTDAGTPPAVLGADLIHFTTGPNNRRSLWFNTPQDITAFTASFTYRAGSISASAARQGLTFTLQNAGLSALGTGLGFEGLAPSATVTIETDTGPGLTYTGYYANGVNGGGSVPTTPVNAFGFGEIDVAITYAGSLLSVFMTDGVNSYSRPNQFVGDLSALLGSQSAFVGFTAGTSSTLGSGGGSNQFLSNFRFTSVQAPATAGLLTIGGLCGLRRRR